MLIISAYLTTASHLRHDPKDLPAIKNADKSEDPDGQKYNDRTKMMDLYHRPNSRQYKNATLSTYPRRMKLSRRGNSERSSPGFSPSRSSEKSMQRKESPSKDSRSQSPAKILLSPLKDKKVGLKQASGGSPLESSLSPRIKSIAQTGSGTPNEKANYEVFKSPRNPFDSWSSREPFKFSGKPNAKSSQDLEAKGNPGIKDNLEPKRSSRSDVAVAIARVDRYRKRRDARLKSGQKSETRVSSISENLSHFTGLVGIPSNLSRIKVKGDKTGGLYEKLERENWEGQEFMGAMLHPTGSKFDDFESPRR